MMAELEVSKDRVIACSNTTMLIVSYILPIALSNFIQASWAERYILTLKRRLYMMLRSELSKNWIHYLPIVTNSLNNSPLESLGFLKPSDIRTEADSVKVDEALRKNGISPKESLPTFQEQNENQKNYEQNKKNLQTGMYCYLSFDEKLFDKSFDIAVRLNISYC